MASAELADKLFGKDGNLSGQIHAQVLIADLHLMMNEKSKAKAVAKAALNLALSLWDGQEEEEACHAVLERIEGKKEAPVVAQVQQQVVQEDSDAPAAFIPQARSLAVV